MKKLLEQKLQGYKSYRIVVVGCGGTGSNLAPHLCQWAYSVQQKHKCKITIILVDQDVIEPDNIGRQFFVEKDLGDNKARVLSVRYATAWGVDVEYHPYYIRDVETLVKLLRPDNNQSRNHELPVLLGCVDNNVARQRMHDAFLALDTIGYTDTGNSEFNGQVVLGLKIEGETLLKPVADFWPDILTATDDVQVGGTCAVKVVKEPQNLLANLGAAYNLLCFLNNIVALKTVSAYMATYDSQTMVCRPEFVRDVPNLKVV